jgi:hypothetical protein
MSTTLANHTGAFDEAAFIQAALSAIPGRYSSGVTVTVMPNTRRLQTSSSSISTDLNVLYKIEHIQGEAAVSDIKQQLESPTGSTALVNNYKQLSAVTTVSSATTTAVGAPILEPRRRVKKTSGGTIPAVVSVVVIVLLLAAAAWWKREAVRARYLNIKQRIQGRQKKPAVGDPGLFTRAPHAAWSGLGAVAGTKKTTIHQLCVKHNVQRYIILC